MYRSSFFSTNANIHSSNAALSRAGHERSGNGAPLHRVGLEREVRSTVFVTDIDLTIAIDATYDPEMDS